MRQPQETSAVASASPQSAARGPRARQAAALYAAVALGSVLGGVLRALASAVMIATMGPEFPWGTLFVNVTGSFLIGAYATLTGPDGRWLASAYQRQFVMTGVFGGYTTFSIFSLETFGLARSGELTNAALYVGTSIVASLLFVWLGHVLAVGLNRPRPL